jgi:hypothetical protein
MNRIANSAPRAVNQTRNDVAAAAPRRESKADASPFDLAASSFTAFNPMTAWMNVMSASMAMWSPLGYGAMQGPLGY